MPPLRKPSRRTFLTALATAGVAGLALPVIHQPGSAQTLAPTPACTDDDEPTTELTEGPFYTPNSPRRTNLREEGMEGTPIVLTGLVLTTSCKPIANALVDLWHADNNGNYDNDGYRLRGHHFTDAGGRYRFETIIPGLYRGRTRHFHTKFQAPGGKILTTQFYFPGEPGNGRDGLFREELLLQLSNGGKTGRIDVVLDVV
jgi:protocatechuate 3,4-dioxygenase beta subunit